MFSLHIGHPPAFPRTLVTQMALIISDHGEAGRHSCKSKVNSFTPWAVTKGGGLPPEIVTIHLNWVTENSPKFKPFMFYKRVVKHIIAFKPLFYADFGKKNKVA